MLSLKNYFLDVAILDPVADQVRLGSRYCTGGYIYQVTDAALGPLVSGPGYPPELYPPVFDGQGLPEAFVTPLGPDDKDTILVLGVGLVHKPTMKVQEFCAWAVTQSPGLVRMETTHAFQGASLRIVRDVTLAGRTLGSITRLVNTGPKEIPLRWFPHPFFPHDPTGRCCRFGVPASFPDNPGYALDAEGFVVRKLDHAWDRRGHFQVVELGTRAPLAVEQKHPKLGIVPVTCDYVPAWMPIWGNCYTFSFEPYLDQPVAAGQEAQWSITYQF